MQAGMFSVGVEPQESIEIRRCFSILNTTQLDYVATLNKAQRKNKGVEFKEYEKKWVEPLLLFIKSTHRSFSRMIFFVMMMAWRCTRNGYND